MEDIKIKAFEQKIVETCNAINDLNNRSKYYVLKDIAEKLLEASERDIAVAMAVTQQSKEGGGT